MPATFFWRDVPASPNQGITLAGNGVVIAIAETTFVAGDDWFTDLAWTPTTQGKPAPIVQIVSPSEVRVIEPARAGRGTLIIGAMITNRPETRTELTLIINGQEDLYWLHNLTGYKASANLAGPGTLLGNAATRFLPSDHWFTYSEWIPQYGSTPAPVINVLDEGDIHILEPAGAGNGVLHLGAMITDQPETRSELVLLVGEQPPDPDGDGDEGLTAPTELIVVGAEFGVYTGDYVAEFLCRCDWAFPAQQAGATVTFDIEANGAVEESVYAEYVGSGIWRLNLPLYQYGDYLFRVRAKKVTAYTVITEWSRYLAITYKSSNPPQFKIAFPLAANLTGAIIASDFTFYSESESVLIDTSFLQINGGHNLASCDFPPTHYFTTRTDNPAIPFYAVRIVGNPDHESTTETNDLNGGAWAPPGQTGPALPLFDPTAPIVAVPLLTASAGLQMQARAVLAFYPYIPPNAVFLKAACSLAFVTSGLRLVIQKAMQASAWLRFTASNAAAKAPTGLQGQLRQDINPAHPDEPDEYLQVWWRGHPNESVITVRIDDGPVLTPVFTWQNPGTLDPAIIKIPIAGLPGDGSTHVVTVSIRHRVNGQSGPAATVSIKAKLPMPKPQQPTFVYARLIRQGTEGIPDLVEVTWTAASGVIIGANLRPQLWPVGQDPTRLPGKSLKLGYGNESESRMQFEGIGDGFEFPDGQENSVYFSVAEIRHNVIGPALFTVDPLRIKAFKNEPIEPLTPDEISGSAVHSLDLRQWVYEGLPPLDQQIAAYAYDKLLLRIKDIVAKGGNVTVDDFGRFEARWSASKPVRGPAGTSYLKPGTRGIGFAPSPGFKEGTERGYVMTDADVKALV